MQTQKEVWNVPELEKGKWLEQNEQGRAGAGEEVRSSGSSPQWKAIGEFEALTISKYCRGGEKGAEMGRESVCFKYGDDI